MTIDDLLALAIGTAAFAVALAILEGIWSNYREGK